MSEVVIKVENLGKQYRLGQVGTGTIAHDFNRWWYKVRGKEDPYLKIGETNDRSQKGTSDLVWALKDINFEVKQGEVLGIIGKNGAGKSTLLKILSRVTGPTVGDIKVRGRIASLLEVGTGFHPELTGRENIFLNGAILGMTKQEIKYKFDEIVDFSGVERFIDTPVKRYSSGMYVRLAFAVAAHLDPEILIVDEVLAVGDAEFQKKCLGKMKDVAGQGRTVLFVSHNMGAISSLCNRGVVLSNGEVKFIGKVDKCLAFYTSLGSNEGDSIYEDSQCLNNTIHKIQILSELKEKKNNFQFNEKIVIQFTFQVESIHENVEIGFRVIDQKERVVFTSQKPTSTFKKNQAGVYDIVSVIPSNFLVPNSYKLVVALHVPNSKIFSYIEEKVVFTIEETGTDFYHYAGNDYGCVFVDCDWKNYNLIN
jgi:lipopolysaccharide transport system ATP-binding protein